MDNNLKYGNVCFEDIDNILITLNLTQDKSEELRKRLMENFTSFLPCDIPQSVIIDYSQSDIRNIIDYMYSQKTNSEEMNSALDYIKHSYNIKFVTNRIRHIFEEPDFINREKELYYIEAFCTDEMMGKSFDLFYKWYFAIISYLDYKKGMISGKQLFDLFQRVMSSGIGFAGEHLGSLFQQMMMVYFLEFQESHNTQGVLDFYNHSKEYGFDLNIYEYMVQTKFDTPELNPKKYIIDLWDERDPNFYGYSLHIADKTGLTSRKVMDFLIENKIINKQDIFDSWDSGEEPINIAYSFGLEIPDVQAFLKENVEKLKRNSCEDLWLLDKDYFDDDW